MAFHTSAIPATSTEVTLVAVSVKNTFIDGFYEEELAQAVPLRRKGSSLPPKFRLLNDEGLRCSKKLQEVQCAASVDNSTGEEVASTEVATSEGESRSEVGMSEVDDTFMEGETFSWADCTTMHQAPPVPLQSPLKTKTSLNSQAKAWNPGKPSQSWAAPANKLCTNSVDNGISFRLQLTTVITATRIALLTCTHVMTVEIIEADAAYNIVVHIPPKDAWFKEAALTVAKQALLNETEKSQHVYVCGYRHRPFVMAPAGFIATLGCVPNENMACWGLIQQGFCKFGQRCQWQHPELQTTVTVTVVLDDAKQQ